MLGSKTGMEIKVKSSKANKPFTTRRKYHANHYWKTTATREQGLNTPHCNDNARKTLSKTHSCTTIETQKQIMCRAINRTNYDTKVNVQISIGLKASSERKQTITTLSSSRSIFENISDRSIGSCAFL